MTDLQRNLSVPASQTHDQRETKGVDQTLKCPIFPEGAIVSYGIQGLCVIQKQETRTIGGTSTLFYKLEKLKSPLSRSQKQEPSIWVPVKDAEKMGLRAVVTREELEASYELLKSTEVFFNLEAKWSDVQPLLERTVRVEGFSGVMKVFAYLFMLEKRQIKLTPETARFAETISRILYREAVQASGDSLKNLESKIIKNLRSKIAANH
jgi:RNA polymerase-interacting CarD/CdnL/TRCF family regulator